MASLYGEVLAPLSDELRTFEGMVRRRYWVTSYAERLQNARSTQEGFRSALEELESSLGIIRAEIDGALAESSRERAQHRAEIQSLQSFCAAFKNTTSLEERSRLAPPRPDIAARMADIREQMKLTENERQKIECTETGKEQRKQLAELSRSVNKLRSSLGALVGIPYTDAINRINKLKSEITRAVQRSIQLT
jgi:hypothetical protein